MFARVAPSLSLPLTTNVHDKESGRILKKVVGHGVALNEQLSHR